MCDVRRYCGLFRSSSVQDGVVKQRGARRRAPMPAATHHTVPVACATSETAEPAKPLRGWSLSQLARGCSEACGCIVATSIAHMLRQPFLPRWACHASVYGRHAELKPHLTPGQQYCRCRVALTSKELCLTMLSRWVGCYNIMA